MGTINQSFSKYLLLHSTEVVVFIFGWTIPLNYFFPKTTGLLKIACKSLIMLYYHQILDSIFPLAQVCISFWNWLVVGPFWSEKSIFMDNFDNVTLKTEVHELSSLRSMINQFQKSWPNG